MKQFYIAMNENKKGEGSNMNYLLVMPSSTKIIENSSVIKEKI